MKILNYFNTTKEEVEAKKFNIIIGISLGNKYFSNKENVKEFILWALENSVNDVVVLIPDKIHTINYEIRSGYSKEKAERATHKKSADTKKMVEEMTATLSEKDRARIAILTWEDIENDPNYQKRKNILYREFKNNLEFHKRIIEATKESVNQNILKLENDDFEKLASYPLDELPILIAGFQYNGRRYNLIPYPGISKIDYITTDLQNGTSFPGISKELNVHEKVSIIEAYAK